jgi:hypothetical protein
VSKDAPFRRMVSRLTRARVGFRRGLSEAGARAAADEASNSLDGRAATEVYRSAEAVRIGGFDQRGFFRGGLSADGSLLCLAHAEHGDLIHPALRVIDPRSGVTVGKQLDPGLSLVAKCWAPVPGDERLALEHEREGEVRPALWDLATGERRDLHLELVGEVRVEDWWLDGSALLLKPWGAETRSGGESVLVDEAAEQVTPTHGN